MKLLGGLSRMGLAGRVVSLACCAVIVAAIAQWVATPLLMRPELQFQRTAAVRAGLETLSAIGALDFGEDNAAQYQAILDSIGNALPGGASTLFDTEGNVVAHFDDTGSGPMPGLISAPPDHVFVANGRYAMSRPIYVNGELRGHAGYSFQPRAMTAMMSTVIPLACLALLLVLGVIAPFMLPIARRVLKPVTDLEQRIRMRSAHDRSALASSEDDAMLKPLLSAIDEAHAKSEATAARAMRLAYSDPVTRLPNRLHLMAKLDALLNQDVASPLYFAVCDLDGFSKLNVALGPRVADEALAVVGQRLQAVFTGGDAQNVILGRLGADQFAVIATGMGADAIQSLMKKAGQVISEPMMLDDHRHNLSCSFGAAHAPNDAIAAHDLMKKAEIALKEAKRRSGNRLVLFDDKLLEKARNRSRLEAEVRRGIENGEFVAVYQPKIYLESGALAGAEALARWRRPDGALVSPGVFIPIAEELGLIAELGKSVLRDACMAAAKWKMHGRAARIAVNVSPVQFDEPDFAETVERILDEAGLDPRQLELEITESSAVRDPDRVSRIMWPLRERGVHMAIDDFGTGHSNFASITRLPFDVFKIDQQFIRGLQNDPTAPSIVEMILAMAETLGQETVAEGIETAEQAEFLLNRACTIGQGYYFSPPLPAEEFDAFIKTWQPRDLRRMVA